MLLIGRLCGNANAHQVGFSVFPVANRPAGLHGGVLELASSIVAIALASTTRCCPLLAAALFAHRMAELGDDGLAEFGEHGVNGERLVCRVA